MERRRRLGVRAGRNARRWVLGALFLLCWGAVEVRASASFEVEDRVRTIASELRCVVCQNLSVADSPSDLAKEMRNVVRELVQQGKSREEIDAYFVSRYGEYVLLSPPKRGFNLLVWGLPFLAIVVGGGAVYLVARRWTEQVPAGRPAIDRAYAERVQRELRDREQG